MGIEAAIVGSAVVGAAATAYSSHEQSKSAKKAIASQEQMQREAMSAEEKQMWQQRDWQIEDREYEEVQQLESEKRALKYQLDAEQRQLQYIKDAESRGEQRDINAENRAYARIQEQQALYETKMQKQQDLVLSLSKPYRDLVGQAIPELQKFIGNYEESPLYQIQLEKGMKQIDEQMAAQGLYNSKAHLAMKEEFLRNLNAQEADKIYGRTLDIAQFGSVYGPQQGANLPIPVAPIANVPSYQSVGTGSPTSSAISTAGTNAGNAPNLTGVYSNLYQNTGNNIANLQMAAGQARAGLYTGLANTAMSGLNAYSMYKGYNQQPMTIYNNPSTGNAAAGTYNIAGQTYLANMPN